MDASLAGWALFLVIFWRPMLRAAFRRSMDSRAKPLPAVGAKLYPISIYRPRFLGRHFVILVEIVRQREKRLTPLLLAILVGSNSAWNCNYGR
jgi:hypothetical protein